MNLFTLSWAYVRKRALNSFLNILLMAFGIGTITVLLLLSAQIDENLYKNAEGIDVVVGAKGSPIQLILSGIYHMDAPTGNIPLDQAMEVMESRFVRTAYPLSLGDNWQGYRIVGTNYAYLELFGAEIAEGFLWDHEFEVVAGASVARQTGLNIGDPVISAHGLAEGGMDHPDHKMIVSGILKPSGSVLDQLILTSVETMWGIHTYGPVAGKDPQADKDAGAPEETQADKDVGAHENAGHAHDDQSHEQNEATDHVHTHGVAVTNTSWMDEKYRDKDITVLLVDYANPLAAAQFPRYVNTQTDMQAAAPAFEIARLMNVLGVGLDAIRVFGGILIFSSALGLFIALLNSMKERAYDLAVMRSLGGSKKKLVSMVLAEGLILSSIGGVTGILLAHVALEGLGIWFAQARQFAISGAVFLPSEFSILGIAMGIGLLASIFPAIVAYRTEISKTLSTSG